MDQNLLEPNKEKKIAKMLMDFISDGNIISFTNFLSNKMEFKPSLLLVMDESSYSPLILALMEDSGKFSEKIMEYMQNLKEENLTLNDSITKSEIEAFIAIIKLPPFENMCEIDYFEYLKEKILDKFYTERVIEQIEKQLKLILVNEGFM